MHISSGTEAQASIPLLAPGLLEELQALSAAIPKAQENEREAKQLHREKISALEKAVEAYNARRYAAIMQEFTQRRLDWCTSCKKACSQAEMTLVLCEGRYQYSCGYENSSYASRDYSNLYRVCAACRARRVERHGKVEKAQYGREIDSSYVYDVQLRDDGYWVNLHGWRPLVRKEEWERPYEIPTVLPEELAEQLALEWHIPEKIKIKRDHLGHQVELIQYKRR